MTKDERPAIEWWKRHYPWLLPALAILVSVAGLWISVDQSGSAKREADAASKQADAASEQAKVAKEQWADARREQEEALALKVSAELKEGSLTITNAGTRPLAGLAVYLANAGGKAASQYAIESRISMRPPTSRTGRRRLARSRHVPRRASRYAKHPGRVQHH